MKNLKLVAICIATVFSTCIFAQGEEKKSNTNDTIKVSESIEIIKMAGKLAKYGYEKSSVTALIEAAKLYLSVGSKELVAESIEKGSGPETQKKETVSFDPKQLLADAKELAEGDATYLALIAKVESKTKGAIPGPSRTQSSVRARSTDIYNIRFYAFEVANIYVAGDGDTDLDLYVYDQNGNLITKDDSYSFDAGVSFIPYCTCPFTIKIVNRGNVYNRYVMYTD